MPSGISEELINKLKMAVGRLIGGAKRKNPDIVQLWQELCMANNVNPTERLLQLMAWDLNEGGVDLSQVINLQKDQELQEQMQKAKEKELIAQLADEYAQKTLELSRKYTEKILNLHAQIAELNAQLSVLKNQMMNQQKSAPSE